MTATQDRSRRAERVNAAGLGVEGAPARILVRVAAVFVSILLAAIATTVFVKDFDGAPMHTDFSAFWGAARLTLEAGPLAPFDDALMREVRRLPPDDTSMTLFWLYPPAFLGLLAPLGALPFAWAWLAFAAASAAALAFALSRVPDATLGERLFVLVAPATLMTLALGQNAALTCALAVGAVEALRRRRSVLAGLVISGLTIKPQLGLMIPIALAAERRWLAFAAAAGFSILLTGVSFAVVGSGYLAALLESSGKIGDAVAAGQLGKLMISAYGVAIAFGLPREAALAVQILQSLIVGALLWRLWSDASADFERKAAGLLFAIPLATPYALHYELVFAAAGAFYLGRSAAARAPWVQLLLAALWLSPVIGAAAVDTVRFVFVAPLLLAAFLRAALGGPVSIRSEAPGAA